MRVFGSRGLVSMVVRRCVGEVIHKHMVGLACNYKGSTIFIILVRSQEWLLTKVIWWRWFVTKGSTITIVLACIVEWSLSMVSWKALLPRGLIKPSWLLPSLILPTLMPVLIIASIPYNNIGTKLKARGVRIHSS